MPCAGAPLVAALAVHAAADRGDEWKPGVVQNPIWAEHGLDAQGRVAGAARSAGGQGGAAAPEGHVEHA